MKTRSGFVSNSSSTSFCIFGCALGSSEAFNIDVLKRIVKIQPNLISEELKNIQEDKYIETDDKAKLIHLFSNFGNLNDKEEMELLKYFEGDLYSLFDRLVKYYCPEYDDYAYFGESWKSIGDKETGEQFKERVEKKLKEIFGDNIECSTHEEAWRDG